MGRVWMNREQRAGEGDQVSRVLGNVQCMRGTVVHRSSGVEGRCQGKLKVKVALILGAGSCLSVGVLPRQPLGYQHLL